jgi:hypothetical protein
MYLPGLREEVSQGDVFLGVPFTVTRIVNGQPHATTLHAPGIVLSHDCEYDKRYPFALVALVRPLEQVQESSRDNVRKLKTLNTFYLREFALSLPESFVDLRHIDPIEKRVLQQLADNGQRLASLTDDARAALQRQVAIFFGHGRA